MSGLECDFAQACVFPPTFCLYIRPNRATSVLGSDIFPILTSYIHQTGIKKTPFSLRGQIAIHVTCLEIYKMPSSYRETCLSFHP